MADKLIKTFIDEERERCRDLVAALAKGTDKSFLLYCIDNHIHANERDDWRARFEQEQPVVSDVEDLM